ncbi:MAG: carboxypeptidase-like regulatory domain-containing protein, partial [Cytophagia bacterium]|nr:carboxypeptidase-like regulatory domain-containing protein [Cytophagia bacterium]
MSSLTVVNTYIRPFFLFLFFIAVSSALAQETIIKGKVTDVNSGDPIPFVNVLFKGTSIGTTTDFDGNFLLKTNTPKDTLLASYIGYKSRIKVITKGISQIVNFQLEEEVTNLQEVVVLAGENPAFEILRKVVRNKNENDKRKLSAYEYDTYTKIEVDVD